MAACTHKRQLLAFLRIQQIFSSEINAAAPLVALKPQLTATTRQHSISPLSHNFIHSN